MHLTKPDFDRACVQAAVEPAQAARLWQLLEQTLLAPSEERNTGSRFDLAHLAYYFGGVIVLGAMGWFMTLAWELIGGGGIAATAAIYATLFTFAGSLLLRRPDPAMRTPGGMMITLAVGMVPLIVYGIERAFGWWPLDDPGSYTDFHPYVKGSWIVMELVTICVGAFALWRVRFPFLTAPISLALWYLSMDLTPILFYRQTWDHAGSLWLSLYFGIFMMLAAYVLDVSRRWQGPDYGFWLSMFGVISFWFGLTLMPDSTEEARLLYALVNLILMVGGVILDRRVAVLFGALGINYYIGHLAYAVFKDSLLFPFALSGLGLLIIVGGILYQRRSKAWRASILQALPERYAGLIPALSRPQR